MALIDDIKKSMRINHDKLDDEISLLIETAKLDMYQSGVAEPATDNLVYNMAINLYVKAACDYRGEKDFYYKRYELVKNTLSLRRTYY